jgi:hypothetical protein
MTHTRGARARFVAVSPLRAGGGVGLALGFRPERALPEVAHIEDFADLGPALTIPAVGGLGKVLRILRAARIAAPDDPLSLVGQEQRAADLLTRALGTALRLVLRPRFRRRFLAWTDAGVETVEDVAEVREYEDAYLVVRRGARLPLRIERAAVVRQRTESERWYEVVDIDRVPA